MQTWYVLFNGSSTAIIQKLKKNIINKKKIKKVIFKWKMKKVGAGSWGKAETLIH